MNFCRSGSGTEAWKLRGGNNYIHCQSWRLGGNCSTLFRGEEKRIKYHQKEYADMYGRMARTTTRQLIRNVLQLVEN